MEIIVIHWRGTGTSNGTRTSGTAGCSIHFSEDGATRAYNKVIKDLGIDKWNTDIFDSIPDYFEMPMTDSMFIKDISIEEICRLANVTEEDLAIEILKDSDGIRLRDRREYDF